MDWLGQYTQRIENALTAYELPDEPAGLYEPLDYFLSLGGKRIRPVLTLLGAELFGEDPEEVIHQALAIELFHNFTLIHDDIMDGAPLRRNQSTVHEKYGLSTAILSGDVLLVKAYQELCRTDKEHLQEMIDVFNRTAVEVCEGQQIDMDFESRMDVSVAEYIEMIRLKTSVLLGCSLELGVLPFGVSDKDAELLYRFGVNIGLAFQIQDDILDLYGDPETFGKQVGGDIVSNKKTILHLTAIGNASTEQREIIKQLQAEQEVSIKIAKTKDLYHNLKVKEKCEERMNQFYRDALKSLEEINVPVENKSKLRELAAYLIERSY